MSNADANKNPDLNGKTAQSESSLSDKKKRDDAENENGNTKNNESPREKRRKLSRSRSVSGSPRRRSGSRSPSRSRSKSRSRSPKRRSASPKRSRSRSHSRSYSRSPRRRRYSRSRSPRRSPKRPFPYQRDRSSHPSKVVGVFGLNLDTDEKTLEAHFSKWGKIDKVDIIQDRYSRRSKGFAFLYFQTLEEAIEAKEKGHDTILDGKSLRTDYSITPRAHSPTPGRYMGEHRRRGDRYGGGYGGRSYSDRGYGDRYGGGSGYRGRSPDRGYRDREYRDRDYYDRDRRHYY
jgi:transformer-2 protein